MAYEVMNPAYYQYKQPGTPWHPGAKGWSEAPVPGWGQNPNLIGTPRLAVNGCTACRATGAVGDDGSYLKLAVLAGGVGLLAYLMLFTGQRVRPARMTSNRRRTRKAA